MKGNAQRGNELAFGSFGIKTLEAKWITGRQIEAARIAVTRYMQRQGQIWIRIFPDKPITKKPAEVRMGKGKGNPEGFVAPVTPGRILIEVEGVPLWCAATTIPRRMSENNEPESPCGDSGLSNQIEPPPCPRTGTWGRFVMIFCLFKLIFCDLSM